MNPLELNQIIAIFFGLLVIYVMARLLYVPAKILLGMVGNTVVGGVLLLLFNVVGTYFGVGIGINVITALLVGLLGIPGIFLLMILQGLSA
jgi:inhibitor of the pro-sigma K processing machinery